MFGNVTFWIVWPDGYEALLALDDNRDGILTGAELQGLAVWNDHNGNGISEPGEVISVEALGIQSISCRSQTDATGMHWSREGVSFINGLSRPTYDWIAPATVTVPAQAVRP